jgi:uncharacterized YccA/Bax inhibitor family protein
MPRTMRTANPALRAETFDIGADPAAATMTVMGAVHKTALLVFLVFTGAYWTWQQFPPVAGEFPVGLKPWLYGSAIGGAVVALVTMWQKHWAAFTSPIYALLEGIFLGGISALFEASFPGIAIQAVGLTAGTLFTLLLIYRSGLIAATENFKLGVTAATGAIMLVYLISWVLGMFGVRMPFLHDNGIVGIGISLVIVVVAALNLVLDFDFIEKGEEKKAPKYMEWYAAFGLLVTLVWLYLEILRLLAKLRSRD